MDVRWLPTEDDRENGLRLGDGNSLGDCDSRQQDDLGQTPWLS
jgi:hypothetical protein